MPPKLVFAPRYFPDGPKASKTVVYPPVYAMDSSESPAASLLAVRRSPGIPDFPGIMMLATASSMSLLQTLSSDNGNHYTIRFPCF